MLPSHIKYATTNSADLSSDHTPIILNLNDTPTTKKNKNRKIPKYDSRQINWKKFSHTQDNAITHNTSQNYSYDPKPLLLIKY
jgi:hypothetical protein